MNRNTTTTTTDPLAAMPRMPASFSTTDILRALNAKKPASAIRLDCDTAHYLRELEDSGRAFAQTNVARNDIEKAISVLGSKRPIQQNLQVEYANLQEDISGVMNARDQLMKDIKSMIGDQHKVIPVLMEEMKIAKLPPQEFNKKMQPLFSKLKTFEAQFTDYMKAEKTMKERVAYLQTKALQEAATLMPVTAITQAAEKKELR